MKLPLLISTGLSALAISGLTSCSLNKLATSAEPTGFISSTGVSTSSKIKRVPFDHAWRSPDVQIQDYKHIVVSPVTTAYLRKDQWLESGSTYVPSQEAYVKQCNALAGKFTASLKSEFAKESSGYQLTQTQSKPATLILEVALTEVTFGRPAGYVGAMAVPGGSLLNAAAASPIVAFEARVRDAASGKIVATAADRRGTRLKLIDFNQLTYQKANEEICGEWSKQLMEATNKKLFPQVKRTWFTPF